MQEQVSSSPLQESQEDPNPMSDLPPELILDILINLPIKSLLRCRCISKEWCSLISSPEFIKSHLNKSVKSSKNDSLLVIPISCPIFFFSCSLQSVLSKEKSLADLNAVEPPKKSLYPQISLLGSCNGVFGVLEGYHTIILWNPAIRKTRMIPDSGTNYRMFKLFTYGFAYTEFDDDYKVVEVCCFARLGINRETIVNVYSLRSDSWRRIGNYEGGILSVNPGIFFGGALHWLVLDRKGPKPFWAIWSLNLQTETHGEIIQPEYEDSHYGVSVGVLGGKFCVFCNYYQVKMDVWMMGEYPKKESWFRFCSIPYDVDCRGGVSPVLLSESGEILMQYGHTLMLYNKEDGGSFRDCEVEIIGPCFLGTVASYVESMVSPDPNENV